MVGDEDFSYVSPSLELSPEILLRYVIREPSEVKRGDRCLISPVCRLIPLGLSLPIGDVLSFGNLSQSLTLPLFASTSPHDGPLSLPLGLSPSAYLSLPLLLSFELHLLCICKLSACYDKKLSACLQNCHLLAMDVTTSLKNVHRI